MTVGISTAACSASSRRGHAVALPEGAEKLVLAQADAVFAEQAVESRTQRLDGRTKDG